MTDEPEPPLDREMDAALRDAYAFAPAAAEEAAARFRVPAPRAPRWPWLLVPLAAAVGIFVGMKLTGIAVDRAVKNGTFFPPSNNHVVELLTPIAFVTACTEPLTDQFGKPRPAGDAIYESDSVVVPKSGRGSLVLSDGTELRLDRGTRVFLRNTRTVKVTGGRIWARVTPGDRFLFDAGSSKVTVTGTELSVNRTEKATEVQLFSGKAKVEAGGTTRDLLPGQEVEFAEGKLSEPRRLWSEAVATGWMLELVAHSGGHDRELAEHLDRMLEDMGHTKATMIDEEKLVTELGGSCRVPLARYLASEGAKRDLEPRRKAARVLVRIVDASVAPELAGALRDPDSEVRVSAAEGLSCDEGAAAAADAWVAAGCRVLGPDK